MSGWGMVSFHRTFYLGTQTSRFLLYRREQQSSGKCPQCPAISLENPDPPINCQGSESPPPVS